MQILQTARFQKAYKKLHPNQRRDVNRALEIIAGDPTCGVQKKGDLSWLRVYKCKVVNQLVLIGYRVDEGALVLTFVALGAHENFYRDLKT